MSYHPEFFDEAAINHMLSLKPQITAKEASFARVLERINKVDLGTALAGASFDEQQTKSALKEALSVLKRDPDFAAAAAGEAGRAALEDSYSKMSRILQRPRLHKEVARRNREARKGVYAFGSG